MNKKATRCASHLALGAVLAVTLGSSLGVASADEAHAAPAAVAAPVELAAPGASARTPENVEVDTVTGQEEAPVQEFGAESADAELAPIGALASAPTSEADAEEPVETALTPEIAEVADEPGSVAAPIQEFGPEKADAAALAAEPRLPLARELSANLLPAQTAETFTVAVRDLDGNLLRDSSVQLYLEDGTIFSTAVTNDSGVATFRSVPWGNYLIRAIGPQWNLRVSEGWWPQGVPAADALPYGLFSVRDATEVHVNDSSVFATGKIVGKVLDTAGNGIARAGITVYDANNDSFSVATAQDGSFVIAGLAPGTYQLQFRAEGFQLHSLSLTIGAQTATITPVLAANPNRGLLRGMVLAEDGLPIRNVRVELHDAGGLVNHRVTGSDGAFAFPTPEFAEGDYYLRFIPSANTDFKTQWYGNTEDDKATAQVVKLTKGVDANYGITLGTDPAAADHAVIANDDEYTTPYNTPLTPSVLDCVVWNDVGSIAFAHPLTDPSHGTIAWEDGDDCFTYTPNPGFVGTDSFTYRIEHAYHAPNGNVPLLTLDKPTATVRITVLPQGAGGGATLPVLVDDAYTTPVDTTLTFFGADCVANGIAANDTVDLDDYILDLYLSTQHGLLLFDSDGCFEYIPDPGFSGVDSFTYHASHKLTGTTNIRATVTITVGDASNQPLVVNNDAYTTTAGRSFLMPDEAYGVLANDVAGAPISVIGVQNVTVTASGSATAATNEGGSISMDQLGRFTYKPAAGFVGDDTFEYTALVPGQAPQKGLVTMTVKAADDAGGGSEEEGGSTPTPTQTPTAPTPTPAPTPTATPTATGPAPTPAATTPGNSGSSNSGNTLPATGVSTTGSTWIAAAGAALAGLGWLFVAPKRRRENVGR